MKNDLSSQQIMHLSLSHIQGELKGTGTQKVMETSKLVSKILKGLMSSEKIVCSSLNAYDKLHVSTLSFETINLSGMDWKKMEINWGKKAEDPIRPLPNEIMCLANLRHPVFCVNTVWGFEVHGGAKLPSCCECLVAVLRVACCRHCSVYMFPWILLRSATGAACCGKTLHTCLHTCYSNWETFLTEKW